MKRILTIVIIFILLILFVPFSRYSNIADGVISGYHSLISDVSICGNTNAQSKKYEGVIIYILGNEVFNSYN